MTTFSKLSFDKCIVAYEQALAQPQTSDLLAATISMIDGVAESCRDGGLVEKGVEPAAREHWYTRAAAALTQYITASTTRLTGHGLEQITQRKQSVAYIFNASGYRNMKHLIALVQETHADGTQTLATQRAAVIFAFIGLDDLPEELLKVALMQPAEILYFLMLGWLNQRAVLTPLGEKNRGKLLTSGHLLEDVRIADKHIPQLVNAWMYCSYASEPQKHQIKKWLNRLLQHRMRDAGIILKPVTFELKARPKILVIHERFTEQHAMYRCYRPFIATLNEFFDTIAISDADMIDAAADSLFDEVITLPKKRPSVQDIAALIQAQKADVIFYPSLGMSYWTVMTAGLRLAPVQVMSHGHPATSMLDTIDYAYVPHLEGDPGVIHSERTVVGQTNLRFERPVDLPEVLPKLLPASDREVRIAVNSKVMKLSWRLVEICKRIEREATVPVMFSFFPGELKGYMDGIDAAIRAQIPSATVLPYSGYSNFLNEISKCDLALAAFPFGNTNSTVDTCLLGLPTVVHFGPECSAQSDALVLRSAGLPQWLICDNDEDYFQTALSLVNSKAARLDALGGEDRNTIAKRLFDRTEDTPREPFGEVIFRLHQNHRSIQSSPKRVYGYQEILAMSD